MPPIPTQVPPVVPPVGPSVGQDQPVPGGDQLISPEQKQSLLDMIQQIRQKLGSFNAMQFASSNKTDKIRRDLLKQVFEKLQLAGVDLTDRQSVAAFMAKLKEDSPELADMFEKAMGALLGGDQGAVVPQDPTASMDLGVPPTGNMNNINPNEAIQPSA
jgi:hypothetical protein